MLVDTPGLNDSHESNETITTRLLNWLESSFRAGTKLNGIIYVHRISDARMSGSSMENLRIFRQLCGEDAMKNVVLATTFWDTLSAQKGEAREAQLITERRFWAPMVSKGSRVVRFSRERDVGLKILQDIAQEYGKTVLQAQEEIVAQGRGAQETSVARETYARERKEMEEKVKAEKKRQKKAIRLKEKQMRKNLERKQARMLEEVERKKKKEKARQKSLHEKRLQELEVAHQKLLDEQKRKLEELEERAAKAEEDRLAELKRREDSVKEMKAKYFREYKCKRYSGFINGRMRCDKCGVKVHPRRDYYYRGLTPSP